MLKSLMGAATMALLGTTAMAATYNVTVQVENLLDDGSFYIAPLGIVLHDGGFDAFDVGSSASEVVEIVAETGNTDPLFDTAPDTAVTAVVRGDDVGFPGEIDPGETASLTVNVDSDTNRFLSYFAMVVPSNDMFIGQDDPMGLEIFDAFGEFNGNFEFTLSALDLYDAGTEENQLLGAAFLQDQDFSAGDTTVDGNISQASLSSLEFLIDQTTVDDGQLINFLPSGDEAIFRFSVSAELAAVPLPAGLPLLAFSLGAFGFMRSRTNRK